MTPPANEPRTEKLAGETPTPPGETPAPPGGSAGASPSSAGRTATPPAPTAPDAAPGSPAGEELLVLRRMERALDEIRGRLEATARTRQHHEFSLSRLLGGVCQVLAVGMVCIALADWIYQGPSARLLIELALAGVLQLGALTGYVLAREGRM
jgi:hypothetical protein